MAPPLTPQAPADCPPLANPDNPPLKPWTGKRLRHDALRSLGMRFLLAGLGALNMVLLARALGSQGYGVYAYVLSLVTVIAVPIKFGLPQLLVREIAQSKARKQWGRLRGVWRWANFTALTISLVLLSVGTTTAWLLADRFSTVALYTFAGGMLMAPVVALGNLRGAALRGLGRVLLGQMPEQTIRPAVFLSLILTSLVLMTWKPQTFTLTPASAMMLYLLASVVTLIIGVMMMAHFFPAEAKQATPEYDTKPWLICVIPLAMTACMQMVNKELGILIIGLFRPIEEVSQYKVAAMFSQYVGFALLAVNQVQAPRFARLFATDQIDRLQQATTSGSRLILMLVLPMAMIFIFLGKPIIRITLGEAYLPAYWPLVILTCGHLIHGMAGSANMLLNMTGHERQTAAAVGVGTGMNIALNVLLVPFIGVIGAAIATATGISVWNFLTWRAVRRKLGIHSSALSRW